MSAPVDTLLATARAAWPGVVLDDASFLAYVTETGDETPLAELDLSSMFLACACIRGEPHALAAFETTYLDALPKFVARITNDPALIDEVKQLLRIKLFVADAGAVPTIARYRRGSFAAWLRVVSCRVTIDLLRERHLPMVELDETSLERGALTEDPGLAHLKSKYQAQVSTAFAAALGRLSPSDRTILRLRFIDDLGVEEIGKIYSLSKSAMSRRLSRCRAELLTDVKAHLHDELEVDDGELDSIMQLVSSQLHLSLPRLLRTQPRSS